MREKDLSIKYTGYTFGSVDHNAEYLRHGNVKFNNFPLRSAYQEEPKAVLKGGIVGLRFGKVD